MVPPRIAGIVIGAVLLSACSSESGGSCPRPSSRCLVDRMDVDRASIFQWSAFGYDWGSWSAGPGEPCTVSWTPSAFEKLGDDGNGKVAIDHSLRLTCHIADESGSEGFVLVISGLGDPRAWPDVHALQGACLGQSSAAYSVDESQCNIGEVCDCYSNSVCNVGVVITTEARTGGAAAGPNPVTVDYTRRFRIDIDGSHAALLTQPTSCHPQEVSFSGHLWLVQTAEEWTPSACPGACD